MRKITGYKVCEAQNVPELVNQVVSNIKDGWQPDGNLVAGSTENMTCLYQKMVTYAPEETQSNAFVQP